jgi:predicted DNA-binding transcriptional regulator YafY
MALPRIKRLLELVVLLQGGRAMPVKEITGTLQVSRRTFFRDITTLRDAGIPCAAIRGKGYAISRYFPSSPIALTAGEVMSLMLLIKYGMGERWHPVHKLGLSGIRKVLSAVPEAQRYECGRLLTHIHNVDSIQQKPANDRCFYELLVYLDEGRICRFTLMEADGKRCQMIPRSIHTIDEQWFVVGHDIHKDKMRVIDIDHIHKLEPLGVRYPSRYGFDADRCSRLVRHYARNRRFKEPGTSPTTRHA